MSEWLDDKLTKIGNGIESVLGGLSPNKKGTSLNSYVGNPDGNQSNLERFGLEYREEQLRRNEWGRDFQYTKPLVESEYDVQSEFIV